jgi:hypothetical protein
MLYDMGTVVFTGLVLSLQGKVAFMSHQWAFPQVLSMVISVGAMYGYFVGTSYLTWAYYEKVVPLYNTGAYWFFSLLSVPVFTVVLVDVLWYSLALVFAPTAEMLMREIEQKQVFREAAGGNFFAFVSNCYRFGTLTKEARAARMDEGKDEGVEMKQRYGRPSVDLTSVESSDKVHLGEYASVGMSPARPVKHSRSSSAGSDDSVFVAEN